MSLTEKQVQLKEDGNTALAAGDAARALALYSDALEQSGGSDAGRAVLYSNRAAASMLIKDYQSALEDAEACIHLDPSYAKGYMRKGAALVGLGRQNLAAEAYRTAATKATNPEQAAEYNQSADRYANASSASGGGAWTTGAYSAPFIMSPIVLSMRIASFIFALMWLFTFDRSAYTMSMVILGVSSIIAVVQREGRPQFTAVYAERFLSSPIKPFFLLPLVYSSFNPLFPAVSNSQLVAIGPLARNVHATLQKISPATAERIGAYFRDSQRIGNFVGVPEWDRLSTSERFARFDQKMEALCSRFELAVMAILTLLLFTANGNIISVLVYAQVLKLRYLMYEPVRRTIHDLDAKLTEISSRNPIAQKVYQPVRRGVVWFGTQGIQNAQARNNPRTMPSCTIM